MDYMIHPLLSHEGAYLLKVKERNFGISRQSRSIQREEHLLRNSIRPMKRRMADRQSQRDERGAAWKIKGGRIRGRRAV